MSNTEYVVSISGRLRDTSQLGAVGDLIPHEYTNNMKTRKVIIPMGLIEESSESFISYLWISN